MNFIANLNYVAIAVIGGLRVVSGQMSLGDVVAFIQYSRQFTFPLIQTASIINVLQSAAASAERVFELLDESEEIPDPVAPQVLGRAKGAVAFEDVSFRYEPDRPLIDELDLVADAGDTIAIVGPTGAGKTTLVNLLMRFYELDGGRITVDGIDSRALTRDDLRKTFGMVLQDTWLFNGTIRENIAYGREDASEADIVAAAEAAHVDHFVRTLPDGYETVIDDDATNLSAGEKQLLTIARAFLADPPVLILDEATSSVDTRTEVLIQRAMNEPDAGPDDVRDRPSAVHDPRRRHDPGHGGRPHRRAGHPRRAARPRGRVREPLRVPVRAAARGSQLAGRPREALPVPLTAVPSSRAHDMVRYVAEGSGRRSSLDLLPKEHSDADDHPEQRRRDADPRLRRLPDPRRADRAGGHRCRGRRVPLARHRRLVHERGGRRPGDRAAAASPATELFVTTKLWVQDAGEANTKRAFDRSLERLGLDYVDLYLIHQPFGDYYSEWRAMQDLYREGRARAIGVANFHMDRLIDLIDHNEITPAIDQIETHPFFQRAEDQALMRDARGAARGLGPVRRRPERPLHRSDACRDRARPRQDGGPGRPALAHPARRSSSSRSRCDPTGCARTSTSSISSSTDDEMARIATMDTGSTLFFDHRDPAEVARLGTRRVD